jgi:hypothetical protein
MRVPRARGQVRPVRPNRELQPDMESASTLAAPSALRFDDTLCSNLLPAPVAGERRSRLASCDPYIIA